MLCLTFGQNERSAWSKNFVFAHSFFAAHPLKQLRHGCLFFLVFLWRIWKEHDLPPSCNYTKSKEHFFYVLDIRNVGWQNHWKWEWFRRCDLWESKSMNDKKGEHQLEIFPHSSYVLFRAIFHRENIPVFSRQLNLAIWVQLCFDTYIMADVLTAPD